jgi:hypothetical protein
MMSSASDIVEDDRCPSPDDESPSPPLLHPWVLRVAVALTLVPLAVSAIGMSVRYGGSYQPVGDLASAELITRDVGRYAVQIGPFSRDGWHHPGPAMYYLFALPYRLLGSTSIAMNVAALVVNGASVAGMAVIARRRGGAALMLVTLLGCALIMRSLGPDLVRLPWNPYVTVLPYGLLVFLTWSLTCRDRWALPLAVVVTSYVAQTHIGYVVLAVPLLVFGAVGLVVSTVLEVRRRDAHDDAGSPALRTLAVPSLAALGVAVMMWLPPVIQQLTSDQGNLGLALRWFRYDGGIAEGGTHTLRDGWRIVTAQFGLPPEWLFGTRGTGLTAEPHSLYNPLAPVLLPVVAAAAYLLWRWRLAGSGRLVGLWLVASVVGVVATARTVGPVFDYRLGWAKVLGMVAGIIVAWAAWTAVARWPGDLERRVLVPVSVVGLAVLAVVGSVAHVNGGEPRSRDSSLLRAIVPAVVEGLPAGEGEVVVDGGGTFDGKAYAPALVLQLERRGVEGRLTEGDTGAGERRAYDGGEVRARLRVAIGSEIPYVETTRGTTLLAYQGDLSLEQVRAHAAKGTPIPAGAATAVFLAEPPPTDASEGT